MTKKVNLQHQVTWILVLEIVKSIKSLHRKKNLILYVKPSLKGRNVVWYPKLHWKIDIDVDSYHTPSTMTCLQHISVGMMCEHWFSNVLLLGVMDELHLLSDIYFDCLTRLVMNSIKTDHRLSRLFIHLLRSSPKSMHLEWMRFPVCRRLIDIDYYMEVPRGRCVYA